MALYFLGGCLFKFCIAELDLHDVLVGRESFVELCDGLWIDSSLIHLVPIPALSLNLLAHLFKPHNLILCRYEMF